MASTSGLISNQILSANDPNGLLSSGGINGSPIATDGTNTTNGAGVPTTSTGTSNASTPNFSYQIPQVGSDLAGQASSLNANNLNTANATPATAQSATMTGATQSVDPTQTTGGQLTSLLTAGSPYLDAASSQATDQLNGRGLINSTMAAQAGETAAINAAEPIAASNASQLQQQALANQANVQDANKTNAANQQQSDIATASNIQQAGITNAAAKNTALGTELSGINSAYTAGIQGQYQDLLQQSQAAGNFFNTVDQNITTILNNPSTSDAFKQNAISQQTQLLQSGLGLFGALANQPFTSILTYNNPTVNTSTPAQTPGISTSTNPTQYVTDPNGGITLPANAQPGVSAA